MDNKIRCFILDDQLEVLDRLNSLLKNIDIVEVVGKTTMPEAGVETILELKPDIVFLDVEMPRLSGFDVLKALRENHFYPVIIFVTAFNQYAIKAIKEQAFDYLLKPIDIDELKEAISRYSELILKKPGQTIPDHIASELSEREIEVLQLILKGHPSKAIAEKLFISLATVNTHRQNILLKTGKKSTQELIAGIISN